MCGNDFGCKKCSAADSAAHLQCTSLTAWPKFIDSTRSSTRAEPNKHTEDNPCAGLSSTEQQRFSVESGKGSQDFELATMDSNTWVEVNYTQLVANAQRLLPQVKPGAIAMAMVKV